RVPSRPSLPNALPPPSPYTFPYTTLFRSMGATVRLPAVERPDDATLSALGADAAERVGVDREDNPVSSVRYLRDDEVQCISVDRSEEHTSELQSRFDLVCRLLLENKNIE